MNWLNLSILEFEKHLVDNYPNLHAKCKDPYFLQGIGPGWFELIDNLSLRLETVIKHIQTINSNSEIYLVQCKEKFGSLRYYLKDNSVKTSQELYNIINEAEDKSTELCYFCGRFNNIPSYKNNWIVNMCRDCKFIKGVE